MELLSFLYKIMAEGVFANAALAAQEKGRERAKAVKEKVQTIGLGEKVKGFFSRVKTGAEAAGRFLGGADVFVGAVAQETGKNVAEFGRTQWNRAMEAGEKALDAVEDWGEKTGSRIDGAVDNLARRYTETQQNLTRRVGALTTSAAALGIRTGAAIEGRIADVVHGIPAFVTEVKRDNAQSKADRAEARRSRAEQRAVRREEKIEANYAERIRQLQEQQAAAMARNEARMVKESSRHIDSRDAARGQAAELGRRASEKRQQQRTWGGLRNLIAAI